MNELYILARFVGIANKSSSNSILWIFIKSPTLTFDATPPPVKYFICNTCPAGAIPNVFVFKKLDGSIPWFNLLIEFAKPNPIFFVLGSICSSLKLTSPLPNCISVVLSELIFTENLRGTFCTSKIYGTEPE